MKKSTYFLLLFVSISFAQTVAKVSFTAKIESEFDHIADGQENWSEMLKDFYAPFKKDVDETMETVVKLREKYPTLQNPPSDDICYATQNRQVAIKKVGAASDLVIVVGSANSSNTVRLVEVALDAGAKASYRVDFASEIKDEWFEGVSTVGVSSGASVPEELVEEVLDYLATKEFDDVRTVTTAEEDVQFSLPKELRKDLKSAGEDTSNKQKRN